ncbi:MAG: B12-binding domain-containing radical SAM protein [Candidatus Thermoplasmatota archaeon]|nr:B12-binding domain-containing radical SAM protein [Candidatus Thermoplasmatota archaeon]
MPAIVLTSDRGSFTDYGGISTLGYVACMPARIVPRVLMNVLFTPEIKSYNTGEAIYAPYALRKVEASLIENGISDVLVVPPENLEKVVDSSTKVVGITVHDPYGLSPVSMKLTMLFGGGSTWNASFFGELSESIAKLKKRYGFVVIAGGPATWQLALERPAWLDTIFNGEAEVDFPLLVNQAISGKELPKDVKGRDPKVSEIPIIKKAARLGEVQVTRGCPRGCQFCSITPEAFRSIPQEDIIKEVKLNIEAGNRSIELLTDDILLYGSNRLTTNHVAVVSLFESVKKAGAEQIYFPHISAPPIVTGQKTVMEISEIAEYRKYNAEAPVVGLESGSVRIISKYMRGKPYPFKPEDWGKVIIEATKILNDASITPCYTMTIGYPDETNDDVQESINLVYKILDSGNRAWVFPLPVIPIGSTMISKNPFPAMGTLPSKYWELLYLSWKNDLEVTREIFPLMTGRMSSRILRGIVDLLMDKTLSHVEGVFRELMETGGRKAYDYSQIDLNSIGGLFRSIYWLFRAEISGRGKVSTEYPRQVT